MRIINPSAHTVMKQNSKQSPPSSEGKGEPTITDISIYVDALQVTYRPASAPAEATHFFSTEEVVQAIKEIDPSAKVATNQVFEALHQAGFDFCNRPGSQGLSFKWMFKER